MSTKIYASQAYVNEVSQKDWSQTDETKSDYIKNKPIIAQANWDQSDSAAPDYIQNRPFYKEEGEIDIFPEQEITFADGAATLTNYQDPFENGLVEDGIIPSVILEINGDKIEGEMYRDIALYGDLGSYQIYDTTISLKDGATVQDGDTVTVRLYVISQIIEKIPTEFLPEDDVKFTEQLLTEDQQMQARKNLGLYSTSEINTLIMEAGPDIPGSFWDLEDEVELPGDVLIEIWDIEPQSCRYKAKLHRKSSITHIAGEEVGKYWWGNGALFYGGYEDDTGDPIAVFREVDGNTGKNNLQLIIDENFEPSYHVGFIVKIYDPNFTTIYNVIPEEYIPNTIARTDDVNSSIDSHNTATDSHSDIRKLIQSLDDNKADKTELPTSLPNPNALTINGTTYDGSTAVDITDAVVNAVLTALPTWNGGDY